jgi:IS5 family transposase
MAKDQGDLFAGHSRRGKLKQYTAVLQKLNDLVDFKGLADAVNAVTGREKERPKGGRPPYPTQVLLRIVVLQQLYGNLSDEEMEYALLDRLSWQQFVGLENSRDLPDARTIWLFKNLLAQGGGAQALFAQVQHQLAAAGLAAKGGQIIDATIVSAPKVALDKDDKAKVKQGQTPPNWSAKVRAHKDIDADWTGKHGKWFFGYKAHVNADQRHKLIRQIEVTSARVGDISVFGVLLDTSPERQASGLHVHADRGYDSNANRQFLKSHGLLDGIARKDDRLRYDQSEIHKRNARLSRVRSRVEHVFGAWQKTMGKTVRCIGQQRAQSAVVLQAMVYNLRRWVSIEGMGAS